MKPYQRLSILSITTLLLIMASSARAFSSSDVTEANRNYTAIKYLSEKNILRGYPDGSFKPTRTISRAEFLKIVLESAKMPADTEEKSLFKDVEENAWYTKYVRKAKKEGIIKGYQDGTFRPAQPVNKAEGLKIISTAYGWTPETINDAPYQDVPAFSWHSKYIAYFKNKNFLEENGKFFLPSTNLTRGGASEILFRALITAETKNTVYQEDLINKTEAAAAGGTANVTVVPPPMPAAATQTIEVPPTPITSKESAAAPEPVIPAPPEQNFTTVAYRTYSKDFFDNVNLEENFPNIFYLNEVYYFDGNIRSGAYKSAFIFTKDGTGANSKNSAGAVINNSFSIPLIFRKTGNYKLGLILGSSGTSKIASISVLPALPVENRTQTTAAPLNPNIQFKNQKTTVTWDNGGNNLSKIVIFQDAQTRIFFSRQKKNYFNTDYVDFKNFHEGKAWFQIQGAASNQVMPLTIDSGWTKTPTQEFTATNHYSNKNEPDFISYDNFPEAIDPMGTITFSATAKTDLLQDAAVIKPDSKVETFKLQSSQPVATYFNLNVIPAGSTLTLQYATTQTGTYIVEINEKNGSAAINMPVYVKNDIPLIADFFDLNENETQTEMTLSIEEYRKQLLDLVNEDRRRVGLATIILDDQLNLLAQNHAADMLARNFFGHVNPDGQTPDMRRLALKIPTDVGENLAKTPTLLYTHNGLMRSAVHRKNILNPRWQRVGIGMVKNSPGAITTVEEFSTLPLTQNDLNNIKNALMTKINEKRAALSLKILLRDSGLESIADNWTSRMVIENFFSFTAPDGTTLSSAIQKITTTKSTQAFILKSNSQDKLITEITAATESTNPAWDLIGLGLDADNTGALKLTVLYSGSQ